MVKSRLRAALLGVVASLAFAGPAAAQGVLKIAYLEGLSGPFGNVGEVGLRHLQFAAERINEKGGVLGQKIEVVPFDTKTSPQEAQLVFKQLVDQGIRYMVQGNGSAVALALSEAMGKHNARNPEQTVLLPELRRGRPRAHQRQVQLLALPLRCRRGHEDAGADQLHGARRKRIKKVYLINQDYSFGQSVAKAARAMLNQKRPDIEIVGDDLHPLGKVKDFAPYVGQDQGLGRRHRRSPATGATTWPCSSRPRRTPDSPSISTPTTPAASARPRSSARPASAT